MKRIAFNAEWLAVWFVLVAMSGIVGCASDRKFLSDAAAEYTYREAVYEKTCVQVKGPASCADQQAAIRKAKDELTTADKVIAIGRLPKDERKAIDDAMKKVKDAAK